MEAPTGPRLLDRPQRAQYEEIIRKAIPHALQETSIDGAELLNKGKVRDVYKLPSGNLALVTTDRQSAFDRILAAIPFKGMVLNKISQWWFSRTTDIVANGFLSSPHPNVTMAPETTVFPIEFVVRGYVTGSTDTAIWTHYKGGCREYCGHPLPDGMKKNDKLESILCTPSTKAENHDVPISAAEIVKQGFMSQEDFSFVESKALALFAFGQQTAAANGLILVDTKYEFGKTADGEIILIDEVHTPDSSRYWVQETYAERHAEGQEPENIDKEFLRLWFRERCDPYKDAELPVAPVDLITELSWRYICLYETITGLEFEFPAEYAEGETPDSRLIAALTQDPNF